MTTKTNFGVYADSQLNEFKENGIIKLKGPEFADKQLQPSSIDLTLGNTFYEVPYASFPNGGGSLDDYFSSISHDSRTVNDGESMFIRKGSMYLIKLNEGLELPEGVCAAANPKSSTGRIDVHARLLAKDSKSYDTIPAGYAGDLWLELYSRSFDLRVSPGQALNQLRVMDNGTNRFTTSELEELHRNKGLLFDSNGNPLPSESLNEYISDDSLITRVSVPNEGIIGYVAKPNAPVLDLSKRDHSASHFFEEIKANGSPFIVNPDSFYILYSKEQISIPDDACAVMHDLHSDFGEYRVHYAGFFDPGFKAQGVLELRSSGQPLLLRDGQSIARLHYAPMKVTPSSLYGEKVKSNYQGQSGPQLAKYFDMTQ